jgi:hypothetical protein
MKLHSRLERYLAGIGTALADLPGADVESYVEEVLTPTRANLRIRVRFADGQTLAINEAVVVIADSLAHLDDRYHCKGPGDALLFRYDSTPHFPDLPGFPEHKHLPSAVVAAARPEVPQVLAEAAGSAAEGDAGPLSP